LLASDDVVLRAKGCEALGYAHARSAADRVATHLSDRSLRVRLACALGLLDMGDPRGESALAALAAEPATSHLLLPHLELANAALRHGDLRGAQHDLTEAVKLAPYAVDALFQLAGVTADVGDLPAARAWLRRTLALEPHHAAALDMQRKLDAAAP
jgi:Flp pilus assembly protein TadD